MTERKQISLQKDDTQAALDALERLLSYTNGLGDGAAYTIRAALTAQLTKTDDNVSCPSVANTGDINAELLERAKALVKYCEWQINEGTDHHPTLPSAIVSAKEAISRAALTAPDVNAELLEALKEAWSVVSSINYGKNHVIKRSDGEVLYGQTDEWCMWALKEVLPKMEQAIARAEQKVGV